MEKQLIFGMGSGRCGTTSLYRLLNFQKNSKITHESKPLLTWKFNKNKIDNKLGKILNQKKRYVGDVASYYLPYIEYIIKKYPSSKFIILKRPKKEVVESFLKKTKKRKWNHWTKKEIKKKHNRWDQIFPKCNLKSKKEAIGKYWEDYYFLSKKLIKKYPKNVKGFLTDDLNSKEGVKNIINFCEIDKKNQILKTDIKINKSGDFLFGIKYFLWRADKT